MSIWDTIGDWAGSAFHRITGTPNASEVRRQKQDMNNQINAYKKQTEISRQEMASKKDEQVAEKRRIEEKQIRSLRRNYRAQGFLGSQPSSQPGMSSQLGG